MYDYCTATAVVFAYCGSETCECRDLLLLYRDCRGFRLPRKRAVQMPSFMITVPRLPWFSPAAEACQENAVISDHCTKTAAVWGYCGSVPCECRDREQPCHDLPYRDFVPMTALKNNGTVERETAIRHPRFGVVDDFSRHATPHVRREIS